MIDIKCKLDLLDKKAKNTRYNQKRFPDNNEYKKSKINCINF